MNTLNIKPTDSCRYDIVAFGEVMLRLDPGDGRIHTSSQFSAWEAGGEYNVARGLSKCFGLQSTIVTSLVKNSIGKLIEGMIMQGGVDTSHISWNQFDKIGRLSRNGIYFAERGFGIRGALGVMDRGHTAISQLTKNTIDWETIFGQQGARCFHTGGIMAGLSDSMPDVIEEAMISAKKHGVTISYDLNFRPSLWENRGGLSKAREVNSRLAKHADILLGFGVGADLNSNISHSNYDPRHMNSSEIKEAMLHAANEFPNIKLFSSTLRNVKSASVNDFGGICWVDGCFYESPSIKNIQVLDRIGSGDSFAAGLLYGLLTEKSPQTALNYGVAHGALTMTTPGDNSMASLEEVEQLAVKRDSSITR